MTQTDDWMQIEALFDAAWELPAAQRRRWLLAQPVRRDWIEQALKLLDAAVDTDGFLDRCAGTVPVDAASLAIGDQVGHWRVRDLLGRGGMGEVYEVERVDGQFSQRAALKLLVRADAGAWQRFQTERQIVAHLDHPGIARLIDGGLSEDGAPYMVMEHVDGLPIDRWCESNGLMLRQRVQLIIEVCDALIHAHARLVVHRDLKPSNVMVDRGGRPRLIDFGVAGLVDVSAASDEAVGLSLDYAAPEQASDGGVSTATDVFGVGAVLYRLSCGRAPRSLADLPLPVALALIRSEAVPSLADQAEVRRWQVSEAALLADLDAIVGQAMALDPADRYASLEALAADLKAALRRDVVAARQSERWHRWSRLSWKHRWQLAAAVAIVASLAVGLIAALWQASEARHQRDHALREQARLEAVQQSVFHMFRSAGELKGGQASARDVLDNAAQRIDDEFARDPARGAAVLHALGELYFLLTDYEAAKPLLQRLANSSSADVDPSLLAGARHDLAQVLSREGKAGQARHWLQQAQAFWQQKPERWASQLVDSRLLESQLLKQDGKGDEAIALLVDGLRQRIELSGPLHRDTGIYHNNLGVALFGQGQLDEARDAFRAATEVWMATGLQQSPDALNTLNNWGAVELADGRLDAATRLLSDAVALRRSHYGPSAATAALLANYGKLLLQGGSTAQALPVLREAAAMGEQFAGRGSLHHVAANSSLVEALLQEEGPVTAEPIATENVAAAIAVLGPDHVGSGMAGIALARVRGEQRRFDEAARLTAEATRIASRVGGSAGDRLAGQATAVNDRYRLSDRLPVPDTATPSP